MKLNKQWAFIVASGIVIALSSCNAAENNSPIVQTEVVFNDQETHSVKQVEDWLYHNLKDYSTYENISYGKVQKFNNNDVIEVRKPKAGCRFYDDAEHKQQDDLSPYKQEDINGGVMTTMYVVKDDGTWITFRFSSDATDHTAQGDEAEKNYWCKKSQTLETTGNTHFNDKYSVYYKYRAKNSFGAYEITEQTFYFDKDGNITHIQDF